MIEPYDGDDLLKGKVIYAMNKKETPSYWKYAKKYLKGLKPVE